jgi:hypothetical protein
MQEIDAIPVGAGGYEPNNHADITVTERTDCHFRARDPVKARRGAMDVR